MTFWRKLIGSVSPRGKLSALKTALDEGERSGFADDASLEGVLAELRQRRKR